MFGSTNCGKCENSSFKVQELSAQGANYKLFAVQCVSCSTPIGVMEYYDNGSLLKKQEKAIAALEQKMNHLQGGVDQIVYLLQSTRR